MSERRIELSKIVAEEKIKKKYEKQCDQSI